MSLLGSWGRGLLISVAWTAGNRASNAVSLCLCCSSGCEYHFGRVCAGSGAFWLALLPARFPGNRPCILCRQLHQSGQFLPQITLLVLLKARHAPWRFVSCVTHLSKSFEKNVFFLSVCVMGVTQGLAIWAASLLLSAHPAHRWMIFTQFQMNEPNIDYIFQVTESLGLKSILELLNFVHGSIFIAGICPGVHDCYVLFFLGLIYLPFKPELY